MSEVSARLVSRLATERSLSSPKVEQLRSTESGRA
jgi:hypothetical protein